jgi:cardiolipin synthase
MTRIRPRVRRTKVRPRRYLQRGVPRRWRYRLAPGTTQARHPSRSYDLWLGFRRVLWSPGLWTGALVVAAIAREWSWAAAAGALAVLARLAWSPERPPAEGLDPPYDVSSRDFDRSLAGATGAPFLPGNRIEILHNGDAFYPAMLADIARARRSVVLEGYIYWAGAVGSTFAEALAGRASDGVVVKVLLDAIGSATIGDEILKTLEQGGVQVAWYNPIRWYTLERTNHRTHRKSLIVDGEVAYTGGAGIADVWAGDAQDAEHWRDLQVRIEGSGARPLMTGFATNWLMTTGELIVGEAFFPDVPGRGDACVQTLLSSPVSGASTLRMLYYLSLACASQEILIASPYFVPDPSAIGLLTSASRRGVAVTVLVSTSTADTWLARHNSVRLFGPLLEAGVRIHEYTKTLLHYKAMIVDGRWATVGTCNFDNRSFALNEESNISWREPALVAELDRAVRADLATAREITLEDWRRRGWVTRSQEVVASLFQDQV